MLSFKPTFSLSSFTFIKSLRHTELLCILIQFLGDSFAHPSLRSIALAWYFQQYFSAISLSISNFTSNRTNWWSFFPTLYLGSSSQECFLSYLFFFFLIYFIFKLYITVLVLPNIKILPQSGNSLVPCFLFIVSSRGHCHTALWRTWFKDPLDIIKHMICF